jgi:hypothetical protein
MPYYIRSRSSIAVALFVYTLFVCNTVREQFPRLDCPDMHSGQCCHAQSSLESMASYLTEHIRKYLGLELANEKPHPRRGALIRNPDPIVVRWKPKHSYLLTFARVYSYTFANRAHDKGGALRMYD